MLKSGEVFSSACHSRGNAAKMSELSELYFEKLGDLVGHPVSGRDPMHAFVAIDDVAESDSSPWDEEEAMISRIESGVDRHFLARRSGK